MSREVDYSGYSSRDLEYMQREVCSNIHSQLLASSLNDPSSQDYTWIRKMMKIKLSENSNDTLFQHEMMRRFYHKYSASQDYYFSNNINNLMSDSVTPGLIQWRDVETDLDEDEFLKRFYEAHEYETKVKLLSEYYKFHRDIPRYFALPASHILNKYHDKKRKMDYQRIKQILMDEARQKGRRVAMNEDENEIRLTDGDIKQSQESKRRNREPEEDEDDNDDSDSSSVKVPVSKLTKLLPDKLIHSLYRGEDGWTPFADYKNTSSVEDTLQSLKALRDKLKVISTKNDASLSSSISLFEVDAWNKDPCIVSPPFALPSNEEKKSSKKKKQIFKKKKYSEDHENLRLTWKSEKTSRVSDVNLNINLNLRVMRDNLRGLPSLEYDCLAPVRSMKQTQLERLGGKSTNDLRNLAKDKKSSTDSLRSKFKKKFQAEEMRASSKDYSTTESGFGRRVGPHRVHLDSENSLSQKKIGHPKAISVSKLKIHNFSKLFKNPTLEYKRNPSSKLKMRKSRNFENILMKYKSPHLTDKTLEVDSARKDRSDKKPVPPLRSRVGNGPQVAIDFSRFKEISAGGNHFDEKTKERISNQGSSNKLNFKKKKASHQTLIQNQSKESLKTATINLDAANMYQAAGYKVETRKKKRRNPSDGPIDPVEMVKEKYKGSISARTKGTNKTESFCAHTLGNARAVGEPLLRLGNLMFSGSVSNLLTARKNFEQNKKVLSKHRQTSIENESKESRASPTIAGARREDKSVKTSKSKQGRQDMLQCSKFNRLVMKEVEKNYEVDKRSKKQTTDSKKRVLSKRKQSNMSCKREPSTKGGSKAGSTLAIDKPLSSHTYSKSEVKLGFAPTILPTGSCAQIPQLQLQGSISAAKFKSLLVPAKTSR